MSNKTKKSERTVFNKICSVLIDVLVIPIVIVSFFCAITMMSAKANGKVPSILGNSVMVIQTPSMDTGTPESYKVGDVILIDQNVNKDSLKVGDCIAFYAPIASGFLTEDGKSLPIFHRIIRIIHEVDEETGRTVRYFVCHGDSASQVQYEKAQSDESGNPVGDYDEHGNVEPGGGYIAKLESNQAVMQYVTDEFVIGKLKDRANGLIGGLVTFCSSSTGVIALVIVPSLVMIALIAVNLIQDVKSAKKGKEEEQIILAQNMSTLGGMPGEVQIENANIAQAQAKEKEEIKKAEQKESAKPSAPKEVKKPEPSKVEAKPASNKLEAKPEVKVAPKAPTAKPTPVPKAPATPKAPVAPTAPIAPKTPAPKPVAPKAVPKAPEAPKLPPKKG